jgi:hypothetical protein
MTHFTDIPLCEPLDDFAWDPDEVRDLVGTRPLRFDDDGVSVGYDAEQLFDLEAFDDGWPANHHDPSIQLPL